jgi:hypothetical protein
MRTMWRLCGLSLAVLALSAFSASNAAAANLVDGSIGADDSSCSWTNGTTSADPPSTLTIENSSINSPGGNLSCSGDISSATLNNDPTVTFNDAAGTATADAVSVTVVVFGVTCGYTANGVTLAREGETRTYSGTATATKTSGGFLCPGSQDLNATISFH